MKLYGFSTTLSFPCICWGTKGYFLKVIWGKDKRLHLLKGYTTAKTIIANNINSSTFWFLGLMINNTSKGFLTYEDSINATDE